MTALAEQGHADAQFSLGFMYENGLGAEALKWYRLAAEQGLAEGQYNLGNMYTTPARVCHRTMPRR